MIRFHLMSCRCAVWRKSIWNPLIRLLTCALMNEAKENKKKRIFLWVIKDNLSARKFYEKNGFKANGQERLIDGTPIWDVHYEVRVL